MWIVPPMSGSATPVFHQVRGFFPLFIWRGGHYRSITTLKKLPVVRMSLCSFVGMLELEYFSTSSFLGPKKVHLFLRASASLVSSLSPNNSLLVTRAFSENVTKII